MRRGVLVLDGAMGTELEDKGININAPLWSTHAVLDNPKAVTDIHKKYFLAGADIGTAATFQASFAGFAKSGMSPSEGRSAILKAIQLANDARRGYMEGLARRQIQSPTARELYVAAGLGPYGAYLCDGSEYRGNYPGVAAADLVDFHRPQIDTIVSSLNAGDLPLTTDSSSSIENINCRGDSLPLSQSVTTDNTSATATPAALNFDKIFFPRDSDISSSLVSASSNSRNRSIDCLIFETLPDLGEALSIVQLLSEFPDLRAIDVWMCFTCRSGSEIGCGANFSDSVIELLQRDTSKVVSGIGINCTEPSCIRPLLGLPPVGETTPSRQLQQLSHRIEREAQRPVVSTHPRTPATSAAVDFGNDAVQCGSRNQQKRRIGCEGSNDSQVDSSGIRLIVYPNSGEVWSRTTRLWGPPLQCFPSVSKMTADLTASGTGVSVVGGCCRIGPNCISELRGHIDTMHYSNI